MCLCGRCPVPLKRKLASMVKPTQGSDCNRDFQVRNRHPDVRQTIHIGIPEYSESYLQETRRAGRDGNPTLATLLKARTYRSCEQNFNDYVANDSGCRRDTLFDHMDSYKHQQSVSECMCCNVCTLSCKCGMCVENLKSFVLL